MCSPTHAIRLTLPQALELIINHCLSGSNLTIFDVLNDAIRASGGDKEKEARPLKARDDLLERLRSGEIKAYGVQPGAHTHELIPPVHWERIDSLTILPNSMGPNDVGRDGQTLYQNVLVEKSDVLRLWPPLTDGLRGKLSPDELVAVAKRLSASGETDGKQAWITAKSEGIVCTRNEFLDAWAQTPNARKQGPKGPRRNYPVKRDNLG